MPLLVAPTGHTLELPARHLTFGESAQCDIPLTGGYGLAALHFEIAPGTDGLFYLRDASGRAGTQINGQAVFVSALKDGDTITAGQLTLRFALAAAETPAEPGTAAADGIAPPSPPSPPAAVAAVAPNPVVPLAPVAPSAPAVPIPAAPAHVTVKLPMAGQTITAADARPSHSSPPSPASPVSRPAAPLPAGKPILPERTRVPAPSPLMMRVACGVLILLAGAAFCATDPGQRLISPWISKIQAWNTARSPKPKAPAVTPPAAANTATATATATAATKGPAPVIIPQVPHEEITRRLLTERTQTLIFADLRQLIPSYNMMASQQGLPSQREMSESFRSTYGAVIDPFEKLSLLQSDKKDEFLLILTSGKVIDLEKVIGQPARPGTDGTAASRIYTLKTGSRNLAAASYDAFTLLLGSPRAIANATQSDTGPQLREARCMFPEMAHRTPGALILVKRINLPPVPGEGAPATAFETIVTNLFLTSDGASSLTLTRNPDVSEKAFVDAAGPALKQQAGEIAPSLGTDAKTLADLSPGEINLTLNQASVTLPGGAALISSALETMARGFVRTAPSISTILQAQDAVMRFNTARATGAETALRASTSREALELLHEGIRGGGRYGGATFQFTSQPDQLDNLSSLLAVDDAVGLVYRPDPAALEGSVGALALKARNYRNAELLITLWQKAELKAGADETPASSARRVLAWANTPAGRYQRTILGLPSLTAEELEGALSHLAVSEHQLTWKPGEANYRSWVRLVHPDPRRDASRLAATYNAAAAAGAIPASATKDLRMALSLITRGVSGRGENADATYKLDTFTPAELAAATALLKMEDGKMKVTATASNPSATLR